ncbi:hypothetical protein KOW79_020450 [Hemibagrus wyckioides]|uniref:Interferon-induced protein 44-like n=1 Tax=Hemibagrus wyckioides TaxID=337641 RepID=A0A9D3N6D9_9TELE|nr:hypothetical protein KOW79_020450 [Hemibagrus wyckioides]
MGHSGSKSSLPPPERPEFTSPWRPMTWEILVVGEVGAGKSSFINSVINTFQRRVTSRALYKTHYIEGEDGSPLPFVFNDSMGLEREEGGARSEDIISAMKGFLQEGHKFNPLSPVSPNDPGYRSNPSTEDQTFCLVNIIAADKVSLMHDDVFAKLKRIREEATNLNLPQVIIMTRPDIACPLVHSDLRKLYYSRKIKDKMQECSNRLGIPMNHIFPVKNYHEEIDTMNDMDFLILKALDQIVNVAADAVQQPSFKSSSQHEYGWDRLLYGRKSGSKAGGGDCRCERRIS